MQFAIVVFDRFTALDAVGPYEVLSRVPGGEVVFVGEREGPVRTEVGSLALTVDATFTDVPHPDVIVVAGGPGQNDHMSDGPMHRWLRRADATSTWTTSVCTGSLILAAAGLLAGRRATSHWLSLELLAEFGAVPTEERVVTDGKYVTAAGVSAGIDMAIGLVAAITDATVAQAVQLGIEYDPRPPFVAGSPRTAPPEVVAVVRGLRDFIRTGER
ncbi:DJ-1/PfpI family protein [Actinoplanes utahensis]|uniref:Glutamine amidotransferase n=1 Tax=Actinoplanes utahensis TaxID=1869 RepID=A0A0A6UUE6_ACTUT|nr:DJ-1/PfpI family protein [Actinoplanes utahensis]KHD78094.1 glutamine amidotransferase [Actinoplanes utahensis]GIF30547.1 glutamine amidotransferase [Actinoplanes utahensis]